MQAKVAIVEDNPITIRSLLKTIDWASLDCEIVGTAMDGVSGRELLLSARPDILLTDIRMPREDGLDMLESVRPELPDMKVIIITGYDHFQYASRAIKLSVFDYILKPIQNEEVVRTVCRALDDLRKQQEKDDVISQVDVYRTKAQLLSLLTNDSHAGQDVGLMLEEANLRAPAYYLMIIQPDGAQTPEMSFMDQVDEALSTCAINAVSVVLYDSLVVYVMRSDTGDAWQKEALSTADTIDRTMPGKTHVGISGLKTSRHQIRQAYQQARQALWVDAMNHNKTHHGTFFHEEEPYGDSPMTEMRRKLDELVGHAELTREGAQETARALIEVSGRQYSYLRALVSMYTLMLTRKLSCPMTDEMDRAMGRVWYVTNEANVSQCLENLYTAIQGSSPENGYSLLTKSVLDYIRLHGAETLRLNEVADKFHVSSNYLSSLIRRETGITFHDHVLRAKMDIAHTMLADPRILVEEVARAVGYSNYISFYNTFKRIEHMTPTEYRNRLEI